MSQNEIEGQSNNQNDQMEERKQNIGLSEIRVADDNPPKQQDEQVKQNIEEVRQEAYENEQDVKDQRIVDQQKQDQENEQMDEQLPEQNKKIEEEIQPAPVPSQPQHPSFTENYVNSMERRFYNLTQELYQKSIEITSLKKQIQNLDEQNKKSKKELFQLKMKNLQNEREKNFHMKQVQKITVLNNDLKTKLVQFEQMGDIYQLKQKLEEIELLCSVQNKEIQQLKAEKLFQKSNKINLENDSRVIELLQLSAHNDNIIQKLKTQKQVLLRENCDLRSNKMNQNVKFLSESSKNNSLQNEIKKLQSEKKQLNEKILMIQKKCCQLQNQNQNKFKIIELQQKIVQYESQKQIAEDNIMDRLNTLSTSQQKDLLLLNYIKVQNQNEQLIKQLNIYKVKLAKTYREFKNREMNMINKNDYNDLMIRYKKSRNCLEKAIAKIQKLQQANRNQISLPSNRQEDFRQFIGGNKAENCQKLVHESQQKLNVIEQQLEINKLKQELVQIKDQKNQLTQKLLATQKHYKQSLSEVQILKGDLETKKRLLANNINTIKDMRQQLQKNCEKSIADRVYSQQIADVRMLNQRIDIYETKNLILIKENQNYLSQLNYWREMFDEIKAKYEQLIKDKYKNVTEKNTKAIVNESIISQQFTCLACLKKEDQKKILSLQKQEKETQTSELSDFHYKELKQTLSALKKVIRAEEKIPESNEKALSTIKQFKLKYEQIFDKYNNKFISLKKQKAENDAWRLKAKQEIRQQFQDIRQLIMNNRLLNSLRQAKSLIDYYEKQQQEQQVVEQNEEQNEEKKNNDKDQMVE